MSLINADVLHLFLIFESTMLSSGEIQRLFFTITDRINCLSSALFSPNKYKYKTQN